MHISFKLKLSSLASMIKVTILTFVLTSVLLGAAFLQYVSAESYQDKAEFASSLEETLGHFWALEQNLDDNNAELALIHATHPIAELYDSMKPILKASDPNLDVKVQDTLMKLQDRANTKVSRAQAQQAIDDAKGVVAIARSTVVGDELSDETAFKIKLMQVLLETSIAEYGEAVSDGVIGEMAEFQDGSAFVWRSQQIFAEIESDIPTHEAEEIEELYVDLWAAYDARADPSQVETLAGGIIHEIDEILGEESEEVNLLEYVENIKVLLEQTKQEYARGDTDLALSLATKAYLDNFEFLEGPLIELDQKELMEEVEIMLREELRTMIKNGESSSKVNAQVDAILEKIDTIGTVVPEFGTIAMMILSIAIISVIAITAKSRIRLRV
jgi:predicted secreted protein with PEFG-CTERM motif